MDTYRLGIDFGTSSTVAALVGPDGRSRPLLFDSSPLLPSAVFVGPDATSLTGADAERAGLAYPAGLEPNPKRRIDDGTVWLGEREVAVVDLVAAVLGRVAAEARRVTGATPAGVVLTHPAAWQQTRLGVLAAAATRAGLGPVEFVPEPVAAAAYFVRVLGRVIPADRCLVIYDLGAGTFDASVVRASPTGFDVVATAGIPDVGGLDLDAAVVAHARSLTGGAADAWARLDWPQTSVDQQARHALWRSAKAAKEQLSRHPGTDLHVPLAGVDTHVSRDEFEKLATPYLDRTSALTLSVLRSAGVAPEQVGGVFLVGGSSRIPLASTLLHRTLRIAPTALDYPELVVAEGSLYSAVDAATVTLEPATRPLPAPTLPIHAGPAPAEAGADGVPAPVSPPSGPAGPPTSGPPSSGPPSSSPPSSSPPSSSPPSSSPPAGSAAGPPPAGWSTQPFQPIPTSPGPPVSGAPFRSDAPSGDPAPAGTPPAAGRKRAIVLGAVAAVVVVAVALTLVLVRPWADKPITGAHHVATFAQHKDAVNTVAFSPKDSLLASGSDDSTVRFWDTDSRRPAGTTLTSFTTYVDNITFNPKGTQLASISGGNARLWDVEHRRAAGDPLAVENGTLDSVGFSSDGRTVRGTTTGTSVVTWKASTGALASAVWKVFDGTTSLSALSPDGKTLAIDTGTTGLRLYNVQNRKAIGAALKTETGADASLTTLAFSPDGKVLAAGNSTNYSVVLWDVASRRPLGADLLGHTKRVSALAFSADGKTVASGSDDKTIRLWDVAGHHAIGTPLKGHTDVINDLAFSADDNLLASAGEDKSVRLWALEH